MRRRGLTETDRLVWAHFAQFVAKLPGSAPVPPPPAEAPAPATPPPAPVPPPRVATRALSPLEIGTSPGGVDRSTWTRFRSGKLAPQRTLDLHGHTLDRAHAALHGFIARAVSERLRCVEVITGVGSGGGGALRREVPLWLNGPSLRSAILAASHPHAANSGSIRLLLRRVR